MGNYISCVSSAIPSNAIRVIKFEGGAQEFQRPMKAAELMLDNPQHFVCHCSALQIGQRIAALSADEELEIGEIYVVVPMPKLQTPLSPSDMASIALRCSSAAKRSSKSIARILPLCGDCRPLPPFIKHGVVYGESEEKSTEMAGKDVEVPRLNLYGIPELPSALGKHRLGSCRYWKPALETISEGPRSHGLHES